MVSGCFGRKLNYNILLLSSLSSYWDFFTLRRQKVSNEAAHQFARITAFPGGDGELQQVDVQNAHVICVIKI